MSDYELDIKQIADDPRCRIYRQCIQTLIADRSINRLVVVFALTSKAAYRMTGFGDSRFQLWDSCWQRHRAPS